MRTLRGCVSSSLSSGEETNARLETAWQTAERVKKVHPDAEISVEVEV